MGTAPVSDEPRKLEHRRVTPSPSQWARPPRNPNGPNFQLIRPTPVQESIPHDYTSGFKSWLCKTIHQILLKEDLELYGSQAAQQLQVSKSVFLWVVKECLGDKPKLFWTTHLPSNYNKGPVKESLRTSKARRQYCQTSSRPASASSLPFIQHSNGSVQKASILTCKSRKAPSFNLGSCASWQMSIGSKTPGNQLTSRDCYGTISTTNSAT